jgi:hypothetical protein
MKVRYINLAVMLIAGCALLSGCADDKPAPHEMSVRERQDAALKDPFGYGPNTQGDLMQKEHISGGGIGDFDKKAMKRDLDDVLSP